MSRQFDDFVAIVKRLRKECPWDREQTHESIRSAMIEEAYEVVDAVDRKDPVDLEKELGDVILNAVFHAVMAEESGHFDIDGVLETISDKLIERHPHVFGDTDVENTKQVLENWEQIKRRQEKRESLLDGIPPSLPALQYAERVQAKAARVGFDFASPEDAWEKVEEESREVHDVAPDDQPAFEEEFGDLLFALVNYGRMRGVDPEMALRGANSKFVRRFRFIERTFAESDRSLEDASLDEMDAVWNAAKEAE